MRQDETALVKQAVDYASASLRRAGFVLPAAYMLVSRNPQTGAPLTHPTAIGAELEEALADRAEHEQWLGTVRAEAKRLGALAVVLAGEAEAEIEEGGTVVLRRVYFLRVEDSQGVHLLHAPIETAADGGVGLGALSLSEGAEDDLVEPLLSR